MTNQEQPITAHNNVPKTKWLSKGAVWTMIAIIGPLALPFLLLSPSFSPKTKVGISVMLLLLTLLLSQLTDIVLENAASLGIAL